MPELMKNNAPAILLAKFKPRALAAAPIKSKPIQRNANNKNVVLVDKYYNTNNKKKNTRDRIYV